MSSNSRQIVAKAKQGIPPQAIAAELKVTPNTVYNAIKVARQRGEIIPFFKQGRPVETQVSLPDHHVVVPVRLYGLLCSHADRRGRTPQEAAQHILENALLKGISSHV